MNNSQHPTHHLRINATLVITLVSLLAGTVCADITNNLSVYLRMDETTGLVANDATPNARNATLINFPGDDSQWGKGRTNGACNFNAGFVGNQYALIDDSGNGLNFSSMPTPAITVAAWVRGAYGATQTNGAGIVTRGYGRGGEQYAMDLLQNSFRFYIRDAAGTGYTIQLTPAATNTVSGFWQHVVGVFDSSQAIATNRLKLYLNGQLIGQVAGPTTLLNNTHDVSLGSREDSNVSGYNLPFTGKMDDVRIYARALSQADVTELYLAPGNFAPDIVVQPQGGNFFAGDPLTLSVVSDGTPTLTYQWKHEGTNLPGATTATLAIPSLQLTDAGNYFVAITNAVGFALSSNAVVNVANPPPNLTNGLLALLKMDETTGLTAFDSTANAHNAILINFPNDDTQWGPARDLGGVSFTNGQYATIDDSIGGLDFATNPVPTMSVALWVRGVPGVQVNDAGIIAKGYGNGGEQFALDVHNGVYRFYLRNAIGVAGYDVNAPVGVNGAWQHLVAVYNNTNTERLYLNGQLVASRAAGPATLLDNVHEVSLAARESGFGTGYDRPFAGTLDDVRLYNRPLTPQEVQLLYTSAGIYGPLIVTQPVNTTNFVLTASSLSVVADGTAPLFYQWRQSGTNVIGATNATLTLAVSQTNNSGFYTVVVTNSFGGSITSAPAFLAITDLPPDDFTSGLAAYWTFDETSGTTAADSSGRGNTLNLFNFPFDDSQWVTTSRIGGRALRFNQFSDDINGVGNDYGQTANGFAMPYNYNLFTFAFWCKLDDATYGANPRVITPTIRPWVLWTAANGMRIYNSVGGALPQVNKWTHYALTYDRANARYSCYVNGVKVVTNIAVEAKTATTAATFWKVGHNEGATDADYWRGQLDDMRVYNRVLSDSQIAALYAAAPAFIQISAQPQSTTVSERSPAVAAVGGDSSQPLTYQWYRNNALVPGGTTATLSFPYVSTNDAGNYFAVLSNSVGVMTSLVATLTVNVLPPADFTNALVAYYPFDESTGDIAHDSSGNLYDGVLQNWTVDARKWEPGVIGNALHFNSVFTNNWVETAPINFANNTNYSFSFWAKVNPTNIIANNPRFISPAGSQSWVVWMRSSAPLGVGFWHGTGGTPIPETAAWHHYVVTFNRITSRFNVYVDGVRKVLDGIPTNPATEADPNGLPWVIGHRENINPPQDQESFRGLIDEMRIYNRQLSINDVEALYEVGNFPPTLSVAKTNSTVTLSWPSWASDFVLQATPVLQGPSTVWTNVPNPPNLNATIRSVSDPVGTGAKYYRLRHSIP